MNVFGIVGGLGPETTANFYLEIISRCRKNCNHYPSLLIHSISFPFSLEREIIQESKNEEEMLPVIKESVKRLNNVGADFIVIPCNTVHIFIDNLRKESSVPIISIIDEVIKIIKGKGYKKIGLLATTKTIDSKLYEEPMKENGIDVILPTKEEQDNISRIIVEILKNKITDKNKKIMKTILSNLIRRGSEAIVLGCTDLQRIIKQKNFDVEILDSMKILTDITFKKIYGYKLKETDIK